MKTILLLAYMLLVGCTKSPVSSGGTNNPAVHVDLLFEHDGVRVYRFYDGGRLIYYTDARGTVQYDTGGQYSQTIRTETVK